MKINYENRVFGLDIMRALAILLVVSSHALWIFPPTKNVLTDLLSLAGVLGVEIFFVLSGFLIGRIIYKLYISDDFSFNSVKYFWIRRWFRTLPNYYLVLLFNILLALCLATQLQSDLWRYSLFFQNFAWEMPGFFSESWSLPIEEFAYIIGPLFLYFTLFFKFKKHKSIVFGSVTLLIISVFLVTKVIYNYTVTEDSMLFWNVNLKAITIYRIDAIYYGVFAAYLSLIRPVIWRKFSSACLVIGGMIFVILNIMIPVKQIFIETHPFFWNVLYLPINSIAIAFCLPLLSQLKSAPKFILKPITFISIISYSIYLLHYSIVLQLLKHFVSTENLSGWQLVIYASFYFFLTIVLSYLLYNFYEKPMTDLRDKPYFKKMVDKD